MRGILVALLIGGGATGWFLWPYGRLTAVVAAPFGASALALVAATGLYAFRTARDHRGGSLRHGRSFSQAGEVSREKRITKYRRIPPTAR